MEAIYFDNAATTRTATEVAKTAVSTMYQEYANPSSLHEMGFHASQNLQKARGQVAGLLGCKQEEVVFTSGGTEANNLAVLGAARALKRKGNKIITSKIEHSSVRNAFSHLQSEGFEVYEVRPLANGQPDLAVLEKLLDDKTILVSIGMVNSELGTISPIGEAVNLAKRKSPTALFHTDAVQAFGKIPFSVSALNVDLATVSAHKIYAPKGVGALYIKSGVRILPIMYGGGQESDLRPGTENTSGISAFGHAALLASQNLSENLMKAETLCKHFVNKVSDTLGLRINSDQQGTPYICNISVPGYRSETLLHYLADHNIYVSSGSACAKGKKSHVLTAMGFSNQMIDSALRVSFNPDNTVQQIDRFFDILTQARKDLIRS